MAEKEDAASFFHLTITTFWPEVENGKIETHKFLEASRVILKFFDTLGALYIPVRKDVEGNIMKLNMKYSEDKVRFTYLQDMIEDEISKEEDFATDALLWLKRGLHFICLFLQCLILDHERSNRNESLMDNLRISYDLALKPHHNWMLQKLFMILRRKAPSRTELLRSMINNSKGITHSEIMIKIKEFALGLQANLQAIFDFYIRLRLDSSELAKIATS